MSIAAVVRGSAKVTGVDKHCLQRLHSGGWAVGRPCCVPPCLAGTYTGLAP